MELKQIKDLMAAMGRSGTKRLTLKKENFELTLEREEGTVRAVDSQLELSEQPLRQTVGWSRADLTLLRGADMSSGRFVASSAVELPSEETKGVQKGGAVGVHITSPMVGTFYGSPSPDDPPFIKVGDRVEKGMVVCIIEAMKVMNEIKATAVGTVMEILVEAGQPVEFGTKLFRIVE